jgi:hypothetical protein
VPDLARRGRRRDGLRRRFACRRLGEPGHGKAGVLKDVRKVTGLVEELAPGRRSLQELGQATDDLGHRRADLRQLGEQQEDFSLATNGDLDLATTENFLTATAPATRLSAHGNWAHPVETFPEHGASGE